MEYICLPEPGKEDQALREAIQRYEAIRSIDAAAFEAAEQAARVVPFQALEYYVVSLLGGGVSARACRVQTSDFMPTSQSDTATYCSVEYRDYGGPDNDCSIMLMVDNMKLHSEGQPERQATVAYEVATDGRTGLCAVDIPEGEIALSPDDYEKVRADVFHNVNQAVAFVSRELRS